MFIVFIAFNLDGVRNEAKNLFCSTADNCRYARHSIRCSWNIEYSNSTYGNILTGDNFSNSLTKLDKTQFYFDDQTKFYQCKGNQNKDNKWTLSNHVIDKAQVFEIFLIVSFTLFFRIKRTISKNF